MTQTRSHGAEGTGLLVVACVMAVLAGGMIIAHGILLKQWHLKLSLAGAGLVVVGVGGLIQEMRDAGGAGKGATQSDLDAIRRRVIAAGLATAANVDEVIARMDIDQFLSIRGELKRVTRSHFTPEARAMQSKHDNLKY